MNMYPTRYDNILDLIFTNSHEVVTDVLCASPKTIGIFSDHSLLFFDLELCTMSSARDSRTVFDFRSADWEGLNESLALSDLSPSDC